MKRTIVASILGVVATVAMVNKSQAQGNVVFANYNGGGATSPVTYANSVALLGGEAVGSEFTADLLVSFGANLGVTYTDLGAFTSFYGSDGGSPGTDGAGLFGTTANSVSIPGYTSGQADFIVEAYNGATYASSLIRGSSAVVVLSVLGTSSNFLPVGSLMPDNGSATTPLTAFTVAAVPEPTTLALAGLGGLASLMAFRRKKA